jgi:galactokinase
MSVAISIEAIAKSDPASEPPITSKIQPALVDSRASSGPDLESRIRLRRAELFVRLRELRADRRLEANEARDKLKAKLSELAHLLKWGISDGWPGLGDNVKRRLEHWLRESRRQLPIQDRPDKTG